MEYYPPPSAEAEAVWPSKEEQTRPCPVCEQLPILAPSSNGRVLTVSHCFCPTLYMKQDAAETRGTIP
jgi:hypothetical protein